MIGTQINHYLERGIFGKYKIRELKAAPPGFSALNSPSDGAFVNGVVDSVTEQAHRIDAVWDNPNKRLTLHSHIAGHGYWIPYLGNGSQVSVGMAQTALRGLGAYTPTILVGGPISWVVTGPFSGCSSVSFTVGGGGKVFAHAITPAHNYTADTVANQVINIAAQTASVAGAPQTVTGGAGEGFVFWAYINATWYRRVVWAFAGKVNAVDRKSQV